MKKDVLEVWKITLAQIEVKLDSPAHFKTWFINTRLIELNGSLAKIGVKNSYSCDWLRKRHNKLITNTLSYVCGQKIKAEYVIDKSLANSPTEKVNAKELLDASPIFSAQDPNTSSTSMQIKKARLVPNFKFSNYVVGTSNKLAHAAATGVSKKPGYAYNPLFIYGKTGLGKTHLGQAIGNDILKKDPTKAILYVSSEGFLNDMVKAIRSGKNIQFRQKYRTLDLLIIDDIQFLSKWQETQNEFFNTFNVLFNNNKQIVLISDRPPEEIEKIESRLRSRFQGGMIVDVSKPDYEMRLAIIEQKATQLGVDLPQPIVKHIATIITDNIRELEGSLQKINLYNSMKDEPLTLDEVTRILGKDHQSKRDRIKPSLIIKKFAKEFNLTVKEIKGPRRTADIAFARQVCMYILREDYGYKLEQVARMLSRKDHTTVIHAVDKIKSKMMIDEGFKNQIDMIRDSINNNN